jgi:hypothetical protein
VPVDLAVGQGCFVFGTNIFFALPACSVVVCLAFLARAGGHDAINVLATLNRHELSILIPVLVRNPKLVIMPR